MEQTTITIEIPSKLLELAKSLETETESFNDLVQKALEKEIKWRKAWTAHQTILKVRQEVKETTGVHPDPIPLIRQLREGNNNKVLLKQLNSSLSYVFSLEDIT